MHPNIKGCHDFLIFAPPHCKLYSTDHRFSLFCFTNYPWLYSSAWSFSCAVVKVYWSTTFKPSCSKHLCTILYILFMVGSPRDTSIKHAFTNISPERSCFDIYLGHVLFKRRYSTLPAYFKVMCSWHMHSWYHIIYARASVKSFILSKTSNNSFFPSNRWRPSPW